MNTAITLVYGKDHYDRHATEFERDPRVIAPEKDFEYKINALNRSEYTDSDWESIIESIARDVAESAYSSLLEEEIIYNHVRANWNYLGYKSVMKELYEVQKVIEMFEYNCIKYEKFKATHNIMEVIS